MTYRNPYNHGWRAVVGWTVVIVLLLGIAACTITLEACIKGGQLCPIGDKP